MTTLVSGARCAQSSGSSWFATGSSCGTPTTEETGFRPVKACSCSAGFWLADNYALSGRMDDARALFERLLALRNDLGLLAEQYDPVARRQLGNFPHAFSHIGIVNAGFNLTKGVAHPAEEREET